MASRKIENDGEHFRDFLSGLTRLLKVAVESTSNWSWFCEEVKSGGFDVVVAHARATASARHPATPRIA